MRMSVTFCEDGATLVGLPQLRASGPIHMLLPRRRGVSHLLKATMPPKALMGSARTASLYASFKSVRLAMPHGLVCFTTTHVDSAARHATG